MNFEMPFIEYKSKGCYNSKGAIPHRVIDAAKEDLEYTTFDVKGTMSEIDKSHEIVYSMVECLLKQKLDEITGQTSHEILSVDFVNNGAELLHRDSDVYPDATDIVMIPLTVKGVLLKYVPFSDMRGGDNAISACKVLLEPGNAIFYTAKTLVKVEATLKEFSYSFLKVVIK